MQNIDIGAINLLRIIDTESSVVFEYVGVTAATVGIVDHLLSCINRMLLSYFPGVDPSEAVTALVLDKWQTTEVIDVSVLLVVCSQITHSKSRPGVRKRGETIVVAHSLECLVGQRCLRPLLHFYIV